MPADTVTASCVGVVKIYWTATGEVHALKGIDALFSAGTVTAVVGPSGSGKTSLLRILAGLDRPTAGSVLIGDQELSTLSQRHLHRFRRNSVGYVFQRPSENLISYLSVIEQLDYAARLKGMVGGSQTTELLDGLRLDDRKHHLPHQLSGGEQQRVAFARAAVGNPVLLIADEPTAELDSESAEAVLQTVMELAQRGIAVVVSTHDPQVVHASDRTLFLRHGAIEAETKDDRSLSVIDAAGRVQLPPEALRLFPDHRALLRIEDGEVRITPP